jgi:hypothetical protein
LKNNSIWQWTKFKIMKKIWWKFCLRMFIYFLLCYEWVFVTCIVYIHTTREI